MPGVINAFHFLSYYNRQMVGVNCVYSIVGLPLCNYQSTIIKATTHTIPIAVYSFAFVSELQKMMDTDCRPIFSYGRREWIVALLLLISIDITLVAGSTCNDNLSQYITAGINCELIEKHYKYVVKLAHYRLG